MKYRVEVHDVYGTPVLRRMAPPVRRRLRAALDALETDPFAAPPGCDYRRLELDPAKEPVYRLRVGTWRVVYTVNGLVVRVIRVMARDEGYDWLG